jgi:hypothetical protein
MQLGTLAALWRYPVKSLAPEALERIALEPGGLPGDRARALMVATPDHARAGKPLRGKEHARLHTIADTDAAVDAALAAGVLVDPTDGDHFFDAEPISLVVDLWVRDVEALVGRSLDPLRWRPNLFVHAGGGFTAREPDMIGATLGLGGAVLEVVSAIGRCVTTTYDIETGESDPAVLREVAQQRDNKLGVYCRVIRPGEIARGDALVRL